MGMKHRWLAAVALTVLAMPAAAQEADPTPPAVSRDQADTPERADPAGEDIIVTGTRVTDGPLQDEAVAGTSLQESVFRFSGSTKRIDVLRSVPGLTVLELGGRSTIVIRGMAIAPDSDPNGSAVQSYIGDVALSGLGGSRENADLSNYDIERIDVLRGPQGFSSGGGALSGIVRTIPRPADPSELSGYAAMAVRAIEGGADFGWEVDGFVNVPIIEDRLAVRVTGYANREESPFRTVSDPSGSGHGEPGRTKGVRVSLRYQPTSALTIDLRYIYDDLQLADLSRSVIPLGDYVTSDRREDEGATTHLVWTNVDWDLGPATLSYVGSYSDVTRENDYFSFFYVGPEDEQLEIHQDDDISSTTQELRLGEEDGTGLDWVIGGYYERRSRFTLSGSYLLGTDTPVPALSFDPEIPNLLGEERESREEQRSGFGELRYWVTPQLKLTGGARYHWYTQEFVYREIFEDGSPPLAPEPYAAIPSKGKWWWKANATWQPDRDQLYYLQVAQAARPGGLNYDSIPASCPPEYAERLERFYRGDTIRTYEAGAKVSGLGGFATINASGYYSRWGDAPVYTVVPCGDAGGGYYLDNAKLMELYGIEFEATLRLARPLSATLAATWAEARIAEIDANFSGGELGERNPGNPTWKLSASLDYSQEVGAGIVAFAGARADYTGRYKNAMSVDWSSFVPVTGYPGLEGIEEIGAFPSGLPRYSDPGSGDYALISGRIGIQSDAWTASLFVDNLLDSHARTLVNFLDITPNFDATITRVTPRTVGVGRAEVLSAVARKRSARSGEAASGPTLPSLLTAARRTPHPASLDRRSPGSSCRRAGRIGLSGIGCLKSKDMGVAAQQQGNFISNIPTFVRQVRAEFGKIAWPTWGETVRTGIMVAILTTFLGLFFFAVDALFARIVQFLLSLAA